MSWATEEMSRIDLGDSRLNQRAISLLESLSSDPDASIPKACHSWQETKAAYRFFDNQKVTEEKILKPHIEQSINRIKQEKRVLLLQDTTELNYTSQPQKQDVGPGHLENEKILFYHPLLAVTPEKVCLGIVNIHSWYRTELLSKKYTKQELENMRLHKQAISEKETYRWLLGYREATEIAKSCPDTHIVMVADREADIADIYDEAEQLGGIKADWLIRAKIMQRSILNAEGDKDTVLLKDKLLQTEPAGSIQFELPRRTGKKPRIVEQTVRVLRVQVHPPTGRRGKLRLNPFWVTAILATEEHPPEDEKPIEWLLLTSITLSEEIEFQDIIQWYLCRWQIETFFHILKSGCRVEELQLTKASRFLPCLAMYSIIAWRILLMTRMARVYPDVSCEVIFTTEEWQCIYFNIYKQRPPKSPPRLLSMVVDVAKLGGFLARKHDGYPGPKTIWLGLKKLKEFLRAIENYKKVGG